MKSLKRIKIIILFVICFIAKINGHSQVKELILNDPDKNLPTNVRNKPGGDVIRTLDSREELVLVKIISKEGNYFLITSYELCGREEIRLPKSGYIHYSVLGGFISNYEKKSISIYEAETKTTPLRKVNYSDEFVNILDMKNGMYQIFRKKTNEKFWIDSQYICLSSCSNCN
jgi:hypothetical protein